MHEYPFWKNPFVPLATLLGVAFIIAASIGAWTAFSIKSLEHTLSVTGSAKTAAIADSARFSFSFSRMVSETSLPEGYRGVDADLVKVEAFLTSHGIAGSEITIDPVMSNQMYENNPGAPTRYMVSRNVRISSSRVAEIRALAESISELATGGVFVQAYPPEYYVSTLAELRVSLLGAALKDAKARAESIAKESGQSVGRLESASSGVVQVLAPNSIDVSDYGQYDTSSVEKEVMVTVRATFLVR